jgi:hypothetical protein
MPKFVIPKEIKFLSTLLPESLEVHTKGKDGNFIAVNHFTKEGGLLEFDSNDITENLIKSRNELMNAYEGLFLSELYNSENDG